MNTIDTLVKSIFQKESLHDCSLEELQTAARQYSYFIPVQFLLAEKLRSANEDLYKEQLQKLSLHFSNPLWLDYLLDSYKTGTMTGRENENINSAEDAISIEGKKEDLERSIGEINLEPRPETPGQIEEVIHEPENRNTFAETNIVEEKQGIIESRIEETFIKSESEIFEPIKEDFSQPLNENLNVPEIETAGEKRGNAEVPIEEIHTEPEHETSIQAEETMQETENVNSSAETNTVEEKQEYAETQTEQSNIESAPEIPGSFDGGMNETPIPVPDLPDLKEAPTETELTFEPYHTVDYFASQGIKYVPEEKPADRFGQQLKSFTEWLKTMKRLPQTEIIKIPDSSAEEKIQQLADHSISEGEVVTEAMAEVWEKQGNKEKAIEIYNKLSLLNPDKSAYFASLAEQLKNN